MDGQRSEPNHFENTRSPAGAVAGLGKTPEGGAASAFSRNSGDSQGMAGFAEHLRQNACKVLYHNEFYVCDGDMFWTCHPDAAKHALL